MKELNWLPVSQRIIYNILLITYKALNSLAPSYIGDTLQPAQINNESTFIDEKFFLSHKVGELWTKIIFIYRAKTMG